MADLEDIESAIDQAASRIVSAINTSRIDYGSALAWVLVGWLIFYTLPDWLWHGKLRYAMHYNVEMSKVSIQKKPHDCDFLTAPLGNKNCYFERQVSTLRWGRSADGSPVFSDDEGKTWTVFAPDDPRAVPKDSTVEHVDISWVKKDDE